jgi:hypothetical protein
MCEYDRNAWTMIQEWKARQFRAQARRQLPLALRESAAAARTSLLRGARAVPWASQFEEYFGKGIEALFRQGFDLAVASVRTEAILGTYRKAGFDVEKIQDIRELSLADLDRVRPDLSLAYASLAALEGAGAGVAVTSSELLTVTGAGPAMVVAALAGDAALTLMASLRLIAHTAEYYGFDTSYADENSVAWLLGMLSVGTAAGAVEKAAAYRELSRVTQQLAQRGWKSRLAEKWLGHPGAIPNSPITRFVARVLTQLGFKVTAQNVEKLLPVIGVGLGAGQNAMILRRVAVTADRLCRERWLAERYGIQQDTPEAADDGQAVPISELLEELEAEIDADSQDGSGN